MAAPTAQMANMDIKEGAPEQKQPKGGKKKDKKGKDKAGDSTYSLEVKYLIIWPLIRESGLDKVALKLDFLRSNSAPSGAQKGLVFLYHFLSLPNFSIVVLINFQVDSDMLEQ